MTLMLCLLRYSLGQSLKVKNLSLSLCQEMPPPRKKKKSLVATMKMAAKVNKSIQSFRSASRSRLRRWIVGRKKWLRIWRSPRLLSALWCLPSSKFIRRVGWHAFISIKVVFLLVWFSNDLLTSRPVLACGAMFEIVDDSPVLIDQRLCLMRLAWLHNEFDDLSCLEWSED